RTIIRSSRASGSPAATSARAASTRRPRAATSRAKPGAGGSARSAGFRSGARPDTARCSSTPASISCATRTAPSGSSACPTSATRWSAPGSASISRSARASYASACASRSPASSTRGRSPTPTSTAPRRAGRSRPRAVSRCGRSAGCGCAPAPATRASRWRSTATACASRTARPINGSAARSRSAVRCNRSLVRALALAAVLLGPRLAGAFVDSAQFMDQSPDNPHAATTSASSEGVYPTGAPRVAGQTCAACHTDGPGVVQLKLGADPASLFTDGYEPGQTYTFELELLGELEGTDFNLPATCTEVPTGHDNFNYVQCDNNNFGLEIDSAAGPLTGLCAVAPVNGVCPPPSPSDESLVAPGGDAVFGNR